MRDMYSVPGCRVERVTSAGSLGQVLVVRGTRDSGRCPTCEASSRAVHSTYARRPADLPSLGRTLRLHLHVRRFYCQRPSCPRAAFVEQLPGLLDPYARRTRRLATAQRQVTLTTGAEPGSRLLGRLAMPTSADTLLRLVRRAPLPSPGPLRHLGVDDWARRKGQTYGTIVVDLDAHRVVELLPDRTAATLATWLRSRTGIEVIARDRSREYTRAITEAAPTAMQVADRWHLLLNVRQMAERWLTSMHGRLRQLPPLAASEPAHPRRTRAFQRTRAEAAASVAHRGHREVLYLEVRRRHAAGEPLMQIGRVLGRARSTVRRFAHAPTYPERGMPAVQRSILDPYLAHLSQRHQDGCENALQLWRDIQALGYAGTSRQVHRWLQQHRRRPAPTDPTRSTRREVTTAGAPAGDETVAHAGTSSGGGSNALPSARQVAWLFVQRPDARTVRETAVLARIAQDPTAAHVMDLVQRFAALIRGPTHHVEQQRAAFATWLADARTCGVRAVETFAAGLEQDGDAIRAALTTPWSNAQTEGQITKLKFLKRQMYGRAKLDLLERRLLLAA